MDPTETLIALHIHEEEIRAKSLAEIYHRPALRDSLDHRVRGDENH